MHVLGAGEHVLDRQQPQRRGRVLHREQVPDLVLEVLEDHAAAARVRRVQQRGDEPVAQVEVRLPVERVVLVRATGRATRRHPASTRSGSPASPARSPYSASSHLMNTGSERPISRIDAGGDEAHPPAVVVDVDAAVQPLRDAQVPAAEVVAVHGVRRRAPEPGVAGDRLAERVQDRAVVQAEHVPADDASAAWRGRRT